MNDTAISIDQLNFRYASRDEFAIRDISLELKGGELMLLAGASGCGKIRFIFTLLVLCRMAISQDSVSFKTLSFIFHIIWKSPISSLFFSSLSEIRMIVLCPNWYWSTRMPGERSGWVWQSCTSAKVHDKTSMIQGSLLFHNQLPGFVFKLRNT